MSQTSEDRPKSDHDNTEKLRSNLTMVLTLRCKVNGCQQAVFCQGITSFRESANYRYVCTFIFENEPFLGITRKSVQNISSPAGVVALGNRQDDYNSVC